MNSSIKTAVKDIFKGKRDLAYYPPSVLLFVQVRALKLKRWDLVKKIAKFSGKRGKSGSVKNN